MTTVSEHCASTDSNEPSPQVDSGEIVLSHPPVGKSLTSVVHSVDTTTTQIDRKAALVLIPELRISRVRAFLVRSLGSEIPLIRPVGHPLLRCRERRNR